MEIVYTVTISLESHTLQAEPFLIVGAITAIWRIFVITAESTKIENQPVVFQNTLIELGLLVVTIVAIAGSMAHFAARPTKIYTRKSRSGWGALIFKSNLILLSSPGFYNVVFIKIKREDSYG